MNSHTPRNRMIDIAKGIAIIAIVFGHVLRGLSAAGIISPDSAGFLASDRFLYMWHLTVFCFLAGLFVSRGLSKRGAFGYLAPRLSLFIYLYLIWQTLQILVKIVTGSLVNNPTSPSALLTIWRPEGQMWFLPFLIIVTVLSVVIKPWRAQIWSILGFVAIAALSIVTWGTEGKYVGTQGLPLMVFFFIGAAVGYARLLTWTTHLTAIRTALIFVFSAAAFTAIMMTTNALPPTVEAVSRDTAGIAWGIIASTLGLVAILAFSSLLGRVPVTEWLAFLGVRSMEIFLAHIVVASGTRIVLGMAGVESPLIHMVCGTAMGVVAPLALWWLLRRLNFPWLFELPPVLDPTRTTARVSH